MEKVKFETYFPTDLDKIKKETYNRILQDSSIKDFIVKNNISESVIYDSLGYFLTYLESKEICDKCEGYFNCKAPHQGFVAELIYDEHSKQISVRHRICDKYASVLKQQSGFVYYEYDRSLLDKSNIKLEMTKYREPIFEKIGQILLNNTKKGIYLSGKSGVGKSYLLAVMANGIVESGRSCAFITSSTLIDTLRSFLLDDGALFNEHMDKYKNVDVLIIDDIGGEKTTVWARDEVIYDILNYRSKNKNLVTCFTSIYSIAKYDEFIGKILKDTMKAERLTSLISLIADELELIDLDRR